MALRLISFNKSIEVAQENTELKKALDQANGEIGRVKAEIKANAEKWQMQGFSTNGSPQILPPDIVYLQKQNEELENEIGVLKSKVD